MKTTLDLPDGLIKLVKLRALKEGRKLKDAVADLLRKGLAAKAGGAEDRGEPRVTKDVLSGLPRIECTRHPSPREALTPERLADVLSAQEAEWHHAAGG